MKHKGVLLVLCIIITLFSIACASANDMNDTSMASENDLMEFETCEIYSESTFQDNGLDSSELLASGSNSGGTFADLQNEINKAKNRLDLTRDYTFTASDKSSITINKPVVINGNGHTISGKKEVNVFEIYGSNVVLNNIKFVDCYAKRNPGGGAVYWQGNNGKLTNCNFGNCNSGSNDGGAVYWIGNNGTLTNCNFVNCYTRRSDGAGGAVCWEGIDGNLANCKFKNCHSADNQNNGGGAILWLYGENGVIADCSFVNCHSQNNGGGVSLYSNNCTVTGCSFMNCSAKNKGGGIYFHRFECGLINCIFKGNSAHNGVDVYRYWPVNVINMTADKISTVMAAFKLETMYKSSDKLNIKLIDINNNDFIFGEEVSMTFNGKIYTQTTDFNGKASFELPNDLPIGYYTATVSYNGDNMNYPSKERVDIFVENAATQISAKHDDEKMEFVATLTTSEGKPIANEKLSINFDDEKYVLSTDSKGQAKISTEGFASGRHHVKIQYDESDKFYWSQREVNVYVNDEESTRTLLDLKNEIEDVNGELNLTRDYAYNEECDMSLFICIAKKIVINGNGYTINGGDKKDIICVYSDDNIIIRNINFINSGGNAIECLNHFHGTLSNCSFINCSRAVSWRYGANAVIANCSFINCRSSYSGGAVFFEGMDGIITNCIFANCSSEHEGGAVYWKDYGKGIITNCSFINCSAEINGGAISSNANSSYVSESRFVNCHAGEKGGGIYFEGANCSLVYPTFEGNAAQVGSDWHSVKPIDFINDTKIATVIISSDVTGSYHISKNLIATLKDANDNIIVGRQISIVLNNMEYSLKSDYKGQVSIPTKGLSVGDYTADIAFVGSDIYTPSSASAEVKINKARTKLIAKYDKGYVVATVHDMGGNPVSGMEVGFAINGVKYVTTDSNGHAKYSTSKLENKTYTATIKASGNDYYNDSNKKTITFTLGEKIKTKIFLRNALYFVTQTKLVQVTLWDGKNQPLANKTVHINAYSSVWHGVTDENGDAFIRVGIGFGVHDATVSFDGDDQYNSSTKEGYIRVIKQTPSVMVRGADTMFKANDNHKIIKVHLRDRYDKALPEGSKIVLKLNGKTYVGTTDINGVASIKISINTVGTFTAQAIYGGNTAYNAVTKDIKIRIV